MNLDTLETLQNYIEIYSFFNEKIYEINADAILNINLELLNTSIKNLNINIGQYKSDIENYESNIEKQENTNIQNQNNSSNNSNNSNNYTTELDNQKKLIALFFMYLMQIDKDSILNKHIL